MMISGPNSPNLGLIWPLEAGHVPKIAKIVIFRPFWGGFGRFSRVLRSDPGTPIIKIAFIAPNISKSQPISMKNKKMTDKKASQSLKSTPP